MVSPGLRPASTLLALALGLTSASCAAPRDPDLERAVLKHKLTAKAPTAVVASEPPPPPAASAASVGETPIKTYTASDITRVLAGVEGAGARIRMELTTALGSIRCTLDPEAAPQAVTNLVGLATAQTPWQAEPSSGPSQRAFYDGLTFHRAIQDFIIQTGNPTGKYNAGPGWRITREAGGAELFAEPGAIAMIDDGEASHGSQFFITLKADRSLSKRYGAFGRCEDLELVRRIANAEKRQASDGKPSVPIAPVTIESIRFSRVD